MHSEWERESVCVRGVSNGLMYTLDYYTNIALSVYVLSLFDVLLYNITPLCAFNQIPVDLWLAVSWWSAVKYWMLTNMTY